MSLDRLLSIYGQPVQSWPGEQDLDEEAKANLAAQSPNQPSAVSHSVTPSQPLQWTTRSTTKNDLVRAYRPYGLG